MLKPLVWNKVPKNRLKGTVWQEVKDSDECASIDADDFQALFLAKPPPTLKPATSKGGEGSKPTLTALLDPKRANNLSIILSRIKLPFDQASTMPMPTAVLARASFPCPCTFRCLCRSALPLCLLCLCLLRLYLCPNGVPSHVPTHPTSPYTQDCYPIS